MPQSTDEEKGPITAESLIRELENGSFVFFHDQMQEAYVSFDGTGNKLLKVESREFSQWIHRYTYRKYGKVVGSELVKKVINTLASIAINDCPKHELSVRIARDNTGVWYDLGISAVHITPNGWTIDAEPPILFKKFNHQLTQVVPHENGSLFKLFDYLSIQDEQSKILLIAYIVTAFVPDIIRPILILHGSQGSGKTTQLRLLKDVVDPSMVEGTGIPRKQEDLMQLVDHHAFIFFDNARFISHEVSDMLSQIITGISFNKRELYTNDTDVIYKIRRPLGINSISEIIDQPDLLQRGVIVQVQPISSNKRLSEKELWARFTADKAAILGGLFDILVQVLQIVDSIELSILPRMADFAIYGYAVAEVCGLGGRNFMEAYSDNQATQNAAILETQPMAEAIIAYLDEHSLFSGTSEEWLSNINVIALKHNINTQNPNWPKTASRFGKILPTLLPLLATHGIKQKIISRGKARPHVLYKEIVKTNDDGDVTTEANTGEQLSLISNIFGTVEVMDGEIAPFNNDITSAPSVDKG